MCFMSAASVLRKIQLSKTRNLGKKKLVTPLHRTLWLLTYVSYILYVTPHNNSFCARVKGQLPVPRVSTHYKTVWFLYPRNSLHAFVWMQRQQILCKWAREGFMFLALGSPSGSRSQNNGIRFSPILWAGCLTITVQLDCTHFPQLCAHTIIKNSCSLLYCWLTGTWQTTTIYRVHLVPALI